MQQPHVSDDLLDLYAVGKLAAASVGEVEEHLLVCETCRERLRESDEFACLFRQTATLPGARLRARGLASWRWRLAAGLAATAMAAVLFVAARREGTFAPAIVSMQSVRGPEAAARIDAGKPAILIFDIEAPAGAGYEARVVDLDGKDVQKPRLESRDGRLAAVLHRLSEGSYWVRVYRVGGGDPVAEYGLQAR